MFNAVERERERQTDRQQVMINAVERDRTSNV